MSLSELLEFHETLEEYFDDALTFFGRFHWIYDSPNNEILIRNVLEKIPLEWCSIDPNQIEAYFDSFATPQRYSCEESIPESLKDFARMTRKLSLNIPEFNLKKADDLPIIMKGLSPKKLHEILRLCALVKLFEEEGISGVVDIGCGLGYIDELLEQRTKLKILGIESNEYRTEAATRRTKSVGRVFYRHLIIDGTSECLDSLSKLTENIFEPSTPLCLLGLHACGDLSPTMLKIFDGCASAEACIVVSCCYHRMDNNFPVSQGLKRRDIKISKTFLRIAAQESWEQWRKQNKILQSWNLFFRASLERFIKDFKVTAAKSRRKPLGTKNAGDIENFLRVGVRAYNSDEWEDHFIKWALTQTNFIDKIRILCVIQARIQNIAEHFVLLDRLAYLIEKGYHPRLVRLFDNEISPRSLAIVCSKHSETLANLAKTF
ncbi:hypothetical protein QYM36_005447 [Artemia franciscana]|uniref:Methyltransferase domain-containing protein n=1 Tax=Artemia franciscana TaxID=6661 RepID=A0AA88I4N5_ARTSF|nr:hypothetical protein QYM36_005447 [Artemia franciscana]